MTETNRTLQTVKARGTVAPDEALDQYKQEINSKHVCVPVQSERRPRNEAEIRNNGISFRDAERDVLCQ